MYTPGRCRSRILNIVQVGVGVENYLLQVGVGGEY